MGPVVPDRRGVTIVLGGEEFTVETFFQMYQQLVGEVSQYVQRNPMSHNTQLFAFLALMNTYVPDSYLLMSECQEILGPPDPIHGGPPFEKRMKPFTVFINTSSLSPEHGCMIHQFFAQKAVDILAGLRISRSATVKNLMSSVCGDNTQPHIIQFIKDLLTKREKGEERKDKFSRLIEDILLQENFNHAVSVLKTASSKFRQNPNFPQTISRLYYNRGDIGDSRRAEEWAKEAIKRATRNSYMADTLGQVYKNRLMEARQLEDILDRAKDAVKEFKVVEKKADEEEGPEMEDTAGTVSISDSFNNRGLFGFIQVAKITYEKLNRANSDPSQSFIQSLKMEVEDKFDFFEWYLTYSQPSMTTTEPSYFWKDIALCYEQYTTRTAAESTSFPGLLDCLNHGLFTSKGRRAGFKEAEKMASDLEAIRDDLKTTYEANVDDVQACERYILSNIILSNKMPNSPQLTPVKELQAIIHRFLGTEVGRRSSKFYLLALMLFWPEEQLEEDDEEVEQMATEDDGSEDKTWEDEDMDVEEEPAQLSLGLMFDPDLEQQVAYMKKAFERAKYAKYLRGRYLLPLFFLGKGSGLSKWIHKSRLDAIVERKVDAELADEHDKSMKEKWRRINKMWITGEVFRVPEIQDILLPVQVEPGHSPTMPQEHEEQEVFVCAGGKKIPATVVDKPEASVLSPVLFYLGFTIQGPVVFKVGLNESEQ